VKDIGSMQMRKSCNYLPN